MGFLLSCHGDLGIDALASFLARRGSVQSLQHYRVHAARLMVQCSGRLFSGRRVGDAGVKGWGWGGGSLSGSKTNAIVVS